MPAESLPPSCSATTNEEAFRKEKEEIGEERERNLLAANLGQIKSRA